MTEREQQLEELLNQWEDLVEQGQTITTEDICRNHPELLVDFGKMVQKLCRVDGFLAGDSADQSAFLLAAGRYQPVELHAQGGIGDVFLARDSELDRVVALKRIRLTDSFNAESCRRFRFEAQVTGHLEHPGIVPVYGYERDADGRFFYAMRLIQGDTLEQAIDRFHSTYATGDNSSGALVAFQQLIRNFLTVCQTIGYAHSHGIIHRDLKPANIMVGKFGETLVVDWGMAKTMAAESQNNQMQSSPKNVISHRIEEPDQTISGQIKGSPAYMSPEQAAGDTVNIGIASDVYSLGGTLYAILTGQKPFAGKNLLELLQNVKTGKFSRPTSIRSDVPMALEAVCLTAMSLRPSDRYATTMDLAQDIERWLADDPVSVCREPWTKRASRWIKRHRTLVVSATVSLVVALFALGLTSVILEYKNRELSNALRESVDNFDQAHTTWRDVLEFALDGQTLGHNVALDPVRLDILKRSIIYGQGLRSRQPSNHQLLVETALLYAALGDVQTRMGDVEAARQNCQTSLELFGRPNASDSIDIRHGRALVRIRLADTLLDVNDESAALRVSLLKESCAELAHLIRENQSADIVLSFGKRNAPAILLAESIRYLPQLSPEERQWIDLAEDRLASSHLESIREEVYEQSVRGTLWFSEACRASSGQHDSARIEQACGIARVAFERCAAAESRGGTGSSDIFSWFLAIVDSIHAESLYETGSEAAALTTLRRSCDVQQALLTPLSLQGANTAEAWRAIDSNVKVVDADAITGLSSIPYQIQLASDLVRLAEMTSEQGGNHRDAFRRAEEFLGLQERKGKLPADARFRLANCQARLAIQAMNDLTNANQATRLANSAQQTLEEIRDQFERMPEFYLRLCQTYSVLGELAMRSQSFSEAILWFEKAEPLCERLQQPSTPVLHKICAARTMGLLAEALMHAEPPSPKKVWLASLQKLKILDSLREQGLEFTDAARHAIGLLAVSSLSQAEELASRQPVPHEEIQRICDPARNALQRLSKDAGPLSNLEIGFLSLLEETLAENQKK